MRQAFWVILLITGSLICFVGYCAALIDWVQDASVGTYQLHHGEALLETGALVLYTYLAIRFINNRLAIWGGNK